MGVGAEVAAGVAVPVVVPTVCSHRPKLYQPGLRARQHPLHNPPALRLVFDTPMQLSHRRSPQSRPASWQLWKPRLRPTRLLCFVC